jgi:hypothetical protein
MGSEMIRTRLSQVKNRINGHKNTVILNDKNSCSITHIFLHCRSLRCARLRDPHSNVLL